MLRKNTAHKMAKKNMNNETSERIETRRNQVHRIFEWLIKRVLV